jgi:hypothetical protein
MSPGSFDVEQISYASSAPLSEVGISVVQGKDNKTTTE